METNEENLCAICLDVIGTQAPVTYLVVCHHFFHRICICEWLKNHQRCPVCREDVPIFCGLDHCDLATAQQQWQNKEEYVPRLVIGQKRMTAREVRKAYNRANRDIFHGALPPLGRSIIGPMYHAPSARMRGDGKLVIRMPRTETELEQHDLLLEMMCQFALP